jgi:hypothetical protein
MYIFGRGRLCDNVKKTVAELGLDGTLQVFSATRTTKKEKGKTKTRVQLQPRRSFKHPSKVNCATVIELEDGGKKIAVADVGSVVYLYDYAF